MPQVPVAPQQSVQADRFVVMGYISLATILVLIIAYPFAPKPVDFPAGAKGPGSEYFFFASLIHLLAYMARLAALLTIVGIGNVVVIAKWIIGSRPKLSRKSKFGLVMCVSELGTAVVLFLIFNFS
jgi:hypothetical protein